MNFPHVFVHEIFAIRMVPVHNKDLVTDGFGWANCNIPGLDILGEYDH